MSFDPRPLLPIMIAEKTGKRRVIALAGSTLPRKMRAMNLGIKQRTKVNRYVGNSEASGQVLGAQFEPMKFAGVLEDRRIGAPGAAVALMYLINEVARSGRECLFNYGPFFRRVLWKDVDFKILELAKIRYRIELEVLDDGQGRIKRIREGIRSIPGVDLLISAANVALAALDQVPSDVGKDALANSKASMGRAASFSVEAGDQLDFVGEPGELVASPAAQRSLTRLESARTEIAASHRYMRQTDWNAEPSVNDFTALMGAGRQTLAVNSEIRKAGVEALRVRAKVATLAGQARNGQVYIAAAGDTLQSVALRFYGTADKWPEIYTANALPYPELQGGEQLLLKDVPEPDTRVVR